VASNSELKQLQIGRKRNNTPMSLAIKDVHRFNRKISTKDTSPAVRIIVN